MLIAYKPNINIVITGHIDHGKSTLIGRLLLDTKSLPKDKINELANISKDLGKDIELAYFADQFQEERVQEKTIDTTQLVLKTKDKNFVIIDAPGHAELIKNMITGATQAQAAILLIDATAGIKEQTLSHTYIISMLGINDLIVVINKMDLVNYGKDRFNEIKFEFLRFIHSLAIKPLFIIPISAKNGINISSGNPKLSWYKGPSLLKALNTLKPTNKLNKKQLRFSIQDIYELNKEKVIVGKMLSGRIKEKQLVKLLPSAISKRIKLIKTFGRIKKVANAGENIGLVLNEYTLASRGGILVQKDCLLQAKTSFRGNVFWISKNPLELNMPFIYRCANQEVQCVAKKIEKIVSPSTLEIIEKNLSQLKYNHVGTILFETEKPIVIEPFNLTEELGRFIIEEANIPVGVGIIV